MFWGIVIIVIVLWGVIGTLNNAPNTNGQNQPSGGSGSDCNSSQQIRTYYNGLRRWRRVLKAVWYAAKRTDCWLRGCKI